MYNNNLAGAVKVNGKVLREFGDKVYMPFSSEYSILIKNMNTKRAAINITIDGDLVTADGLIVDGNSSIDLERFITENLKSGNKFKFIERTNKIEEHRGINIEDGLIKIEFEFEKENSFNTFPFYTNVFDNSQKYNVPATSTSSPNLKLYAATNTTIRSVISHQSDTGITVGGSKSNQSFSQVSKFETDGIKYVMIIKVLGETPDNNLVHETVIVRQKRTCNSCGTNNPYKSKFCAECGTSLLIY